MSLLIILAFSGLFDRIEAVAGDEIILKSEVDELLLFYGPGAATREMIQNELVNRAAVIKLAEKESVFVRDEEVAGMLEQRFEMLKEQLGGDEALARECQKRGITVLELRNRYAREIKSQLIIRRFLETKSRPYLLVTPTEVRRFYNENKDTIAFRPGTAVLKHILLLIKPSQAEIERGIKKITEVYQLLRKGGEFPILAKEFSDDPYSRKRGGLLGRIRRGETVEEFERVVFNLKPGEISEPFQTRYGFHIAEVLSKDEESVLVRQILIAVKPTRADTLRTENIAKKLGSLIKNGADFDSIASIYSEDPMIKKGSAYLGEFIEENIPHPFKEKIKDLKSGEISEPILSVYGYHIIKVEKRVPRMLLSFNELRSQIEAYLNEQKYQKEFDRWSKKAKQEIFHIVLDED